MKEFLTTILLSLCLFVYASAQTKSDAAKPSGKTAEAVKAVAPQTSELAEANRLSAQVAKLYKESKYDEALPLAKRALELSEKAASPDQLSTVRHLQNLAEVYFALKKPSSAKTLFQRALSIYEKKYGKDDLKLCTLLDRLALSQFAAGELGLAEESYQRIVAIKEKVLGAENTEVGISLSKLGEFYNVTGEYKKALPLYQRAVEIEEKGNVDLSRQGDNILEHYACLLRKMKQPDKANEIEARTIIGKILNVDAAGNVTDIAEAKNAGGGVLNGRAIKRYAPPYPPEAKANRVTGKVTVRILVDEKGKVIDACAIDGPTLLLQSAENAAYLTAFSPTLLSGQPVKVAGTITFNYSLY